MKYKTVIELSAKEAYNFFLQSECYCNFILPTYFDFNTVLKASEKCLLNISNLSDVMKQIPAPTKDNPHKTKADSPSNYEGVNYSIVNNKDSRLSWRQLQLINPILYVWLVKKITDNSSWSEIIKKLKEIYQCSYVQCTSLPTVPHTNQSSASAQTKKYLSDFERTSLEHSFEYNYIITADIENCYPSIYTHSIAWAIHNKDVAQKQKDTDSLIGNTIDKVLRMMIHGQTNGIPQGSILMDFIAEIVLAYVDKLLTEKLKNQKLSKFKILRYRDDYRIFVRNKEDGEQILKDLSEVLYIMNFRLNTSKTKISSNIINDCIKPDKIVWHTFQRKHKSLEKRLLNLYTFSYDYPNSGTLISELTKFKDKIYKMEHIWNARTLISIVVQLAYNNPRLYPLSAVILSKLLNSLEDRDEKKDMLEKIYKKFQQLPNITYLHIWLQRISYFIDNTIHYDEKICNLLENPNIPLWNFNWLNDGQKNLIEKAPLINSSEVQKLTSLIAQDEADQFFYES